MASRRQLLSTAVGAAVVAAVGVGVAGAGTAVGVGVGDAGVGPGVGVVGGKSTRYSGDAR